MDSRRNLLGERLGYVSQISDTRSALAAQAPVDPSVDASRPLAPVVRKWWQGGRRPVVPVELPTATEGLMHPGALIFASPSKPLLSSLTSFFSRREANEVGKAMSGTAGS